MYYTKDIYLDAYTEEGGKDLYKQYNDYEIQMGIESTEDFVIPRRYEDLKEDISGGGLAFLVRRRQDSVVIGYMSLNINWITHIARPLYFIGAAYRGNGYGKQLIALSLYVAFQEVNCRKVTICVYEFNKRAQHIYLAAGFKEEGRQLLDCYRNGQYWDTVYLGLFRENWTVYQKSLVEDPAGQPLYTINGKMDK